MSVFTRSHQDLLIEDISLNTIAEKYGTPCYVYSRFAIEKAFKEYAEALGDHPGRICYAVKANSNIAVLQILARLGAGFDIVSEGELRRVLMAGGNPSKIIFSGVGKTAKEMRFALDTGIACFNVESESELTLLSQVANDMETQAPVSLRVNPDVDAQTHPYISTGLKENKFGIDINQALDVYQYADTLPGIHVVGVDYHIGSQITDSQPFIDALDRVLILIDQLDTVGIDIEHLDLGGGIGVRYREETPPSIADYIHTVKTRIAGRQLALAFEPGRSISANAGALLTQVLYLKPTAHKNFAIVDAAMNDNIRPALYQAWQDVQPLKLNNDGDNIKHWDLVGPVCETGDFIAKDRLLNLHQGDRLALMSSGAYGFVMSSNYNSRPRVAEVLVDGEKDYLIRARESFDDLVRGEQLLPMIGES